MYTTYVVCSLVVCGVNGIWCGGWWYVEGIGMWRELVCGDKCYVGEVAWEVNGMLG